ncbi:uncharacterized protein LOC141627014 [Silene latifolia]|uniref:uncharacterized protein LOC141627014 n=1 Tax=Silene latifolia TaxID=37657 RepID=UPI003D77E181
MSIARRLHRTHHPSSSSLVNQRTITPLLLSRQASNLRLVHYKSTHEGRCLSMKPVGVSISYQSSKLMIEDVLATTQIRDGEVEISDLVYGLASLFLLDFGFFVRTRHGVCDAAIPQFE